MQEYINVHRVNATPAGARAEYSDDEARRLLKLGAIRHLDAEPPAEASSEEDRSADIRAAIEQLQEDGGDDAFTAAGKPQVDAIEAIVGYDVTAQERDAVWESMSE